MPETPEAKNSKAGELPFPKRYGGLVTAVYWVGSDQPHSPNPAKPDDRQPAQLPNVIGIISSNSKTASPTPHSFTITAHHRFGKHLMFVGTSEKHQFFE